MDKTNRKCWLTFEGACKDQPCIWKLAQAHPEVCFDIRQASVGQEVGIMALALTGEAEAIDEAVAYLQSLGVRVDPVEGGSLVAG